jgi:hypothetical protein
MSLVSDYESRLKMLPDWPDKRRIFELTAMCERNTHFSNHLADILIARLVDVSLNICLLIAKLIFFAEKNKSCL